MGDGQDLFRRLLLGHDPAEDTVFRNNMTIAIKPRHPVISGHLLVIPTTHVADFTEKPAVSAFTMHTAAMLAAGMGPCNLITSKGPEATQTVFHLHIHLVPRHYGDGLALPWMPR